MGIHEQAVRGIICGSRTCCDNPHVSIDCLNPRVEDVKDQKGRLEHARDDTKADRLVLVKDRNRIRHELDLRRVERRGRRLLTALRAVGTAYVARADGRRLSAAPATRRTSRPAGSIQRIPVKYASSLPGKKLRNLRRSRPRSYKCDDVARNVKWRRGYGPNYTLPDHRNVCRVQCDSVQMR